MHILTFSILVKLEFVDVGCEREENFLYNNQDQPTTNYSNLHKAQSPKLELNLSHIGGRWSLLTTTPFLCHPCSLLSFTLESLRDINMHIWLCLIFTAFLLVLFFNVGKEMFLERVRRLHTKNFFKKYASLPTCWKTRVSPVLLFCLVTNQYII